MPDLIPFFIVLVAGVFFSQLFNRLHLPWVVALIIAGMAIGPHGLSIFVPNEAVELLSEIGLVFLMFMAGLETRFSTVKSLRNGITFLVICNSLIPFSIGFIIAVVLGFNTMTALVLGAIFTSSSIAVIIPSLEATKLIRTELGRSIVVTTIIEDIMSLALFSVLLQSLNQTSILPLPFFYAFLISLLVVLKIVLPGLTNRITFKTKQDLFESELRQILVILIGVVVIFEIIGLHPIIAGFFTGMVLSESISSEVIKSKIHAMGYGIFIPIFFIVIGSKADMTIFTSDSTAITIALVVIVGSLLGKLFSGWLGGRLSGYNNKQSFLIGAATTPHLSTALAVTFAGLELGIINQTLASALIALTVVTSIVGPYFINLLARYEK